MKDTAAGKVVTNAFRQLRRPFYRIRDAFREVKWCVQRARRGFADPDIWDLGDRTVALILKMLTEFQKNNTEGYPLYFQEAFYEKFKTEIGCDYTEYRCVAKTPSMEAWKELEYKECRKKWLDTIDELIHLFSDAQEETCSRKNKYPEYTAEYRKEEQLLEAYRDEYRLKAFTLFGQWAPYLWQ